MLALAVLSIVIACGGGSQISDAQTPEVKLVAKVDLELSPASLTSVSRADSYDLPITPICSSQVDTPLPKPFFDVVRKRSDVNRPTVDMAPECPGVT